MRELFWVLRAPSTVVYDIGAATGSYAAAAAKVASVSDVVAFKPLRDSFAQLHARVGGLPHVRCFNLALGEETGEAAIRTSAWRNTSSILPVGDIARQEFPRAALIEAEEHVDVRRLDDVVRDHKLPLPTVIKLDVQGFEDRVIRGSAEARRAARICLVKVSFSPLYEGSCLFDDIHRLMRALDYQLAGFAGSLRSSLGPMLQADAVFERSGREL